MNPMLINGCSLDFESVNQTEKKLPFIKMDRLKRFWIIFCLKTSTNKIRQTKRRNKYEISLSGR